MEDKNLILTVYKLSPTLARSITYLKDINSNNNHSHCYSQKNSADNDTYHPLKPFPYCFLQFPRLYHNMNRFFAKIYWFDICEWGPVRFLTELTKLNVASWVFFYWHRDILNLCSKITNKWRDILDSQKLPKISKRCCFINKIGGKESVE